MAMNRFEIWAPRQPVRIGCSGWNIRRQWGAHFSLEGSHLQRYAQTFNCCEINSSFYRAHKKKTWERWAQSVPAEFRFSVKGRGLLPMKQN